MCTESENKDRGEGKEFDLRQRDLEARVDMDYGESTYVSDHRGLRVPGGWKYTFDRLKEGGIWNPTGGVFVPIPPADRI